MESIIIELKDMIAELRRSNESLAAMLEEQRRENAVQKEQIEYLTKKLYGKSSEKKKDFPGQIGLFDEAENAADENSPEAFDGDDSEDAAINVKAHTRKKKASLDEKLTGIKTEKVVVELPEDQRNCSACGQPLVKVGEVFVRRELVFMPAKLIVKEYYSTTYKCPECVDDKSGAPLFFKAMPEASLFPHSPASPSTVAWTAYQKYANAVPLYRQEKDWEQYGVEIPRGTLANWIIHSADIYLRPLYDFFHRKLLKRRFAMGDETRVQVLKEEGRKATTDSFMWLFRSGEDSEPAIILYHYSPTRSGKVAREFMEGFSGYFMCDGYSGYDDMPGIMRCACYAHIRRDFNDAIPKGVGYDLSNPAVQGVEYINRLFKYEREATEKGMDFEARRKLRLKKSEPVIDAFIAWLDTVTYTPGGRLGKAVNYAKGRIPYMKTYLEDGRCSLSNNASENAIRPFTVGRKNWLFSDSAAGAEASAITYTMVEMARAHGLNVFKYLCYILSKRPSNLMTDEEIARLAPWDSEIKEKCSK